MDWEIDEGMEGKTRRFDDEGSEDEGMAWECEPHRFDDEGSESKGDEGSEEDEDLIFGDDLNWEPDAPLGDDRSLSPDLIFEEGHFDEPLRLPHSRPPPLATPDHMREPYIIHYHDPSAGAPITATSVILAKTRGPSSTALSELLAIDGVNGQKAWAVISQCHELNTIIDRKLPTGRPQFQRQEVVVQGEAFEVYFRDVLESTKALFGDAEFAEYLKFAPERHFENDTCDEQLYHDMHTGKWWWSTQEKLDQIAGRGRTIIPIILSMDKTQVTVFHNKSVYPVYMSIGNIPKEIRRKPSCCAYILLGYLPTTNLSHIQSPASRRRSIVNLFHTCMRHILKPLETAGVTGVIMASGDGVQRLCHPIFAAHIGDYPEQILVMGSLTGDCPTCIVPREKIGEDTERYLLRHLQSILEALQMADEGAAAFIEACPPLFQCISAITPDILHQLYQGVFKHMKNWIIEAYGAHEIDAHCWRLPPNHNIRIFPKGISTLQWVSGTEHAQMLHLFLGLVAEAPLPDGMSNVRLMKCLRGLLDFLFLAQYPIHFMNHYVDGIKRTGTLDNFNTEYTERLHIDLAKDAYAATNKKDELLQMTRWLERKEKVTKHALFNAWSQAGQHPPLRTHWIPPGLNTTCLQKLTKHPSVYRVSVENVVQHYGATFFKAALARYIVQLTKPHPSGPQLDNEASGMFLGVSHISAYHRIKYIGQDFFTQISSTADSIHAQPARVGKHGKVVPARFDTALTQGLLVRLVFTLPEQVATSLLEGVSEEKRPCHLAYVEWFSPFPANSDSNHRLYKVSHCEVEGGRLASIVDVRQLIRSVHLFPRFGCIADRTWKSSTVLDDCQTFFVNTDSDRHMYQLSRC
ncbi:hypothetical protein F5878DRAFT_653729 [Lentinula raphanica]|uniref:Uncharacterized protein n=1 Tax=Lentinula raphanica TaxID=153919 RepID=A0AA38P2S9_9AGAR|nr:hypothetical protein F5878DRAFT_653729 [Lentinula raphanica]